MNFLLLPLDLFSEFLSQLLLSGKIFLDFSNFIFFLPSQLSLKILIILSSLGPVLIFFKKLLITRWWGLKSRWSIVDRRSRKSRLSVQLIPLNFKQLYPGSMPALLSNFLLNKLLLNDRPMCPLPLLNVGNGIIVRYRRRGESCRSGQIRLSLHLHFEVNLFSLCGWRYTLLSFSSREKRLRSISCLVL